MEKHLALLAQQYAACEKSDKSEFQRRARVLQSMWREERGYEKGICKSRNGSRPLGSRLPMPWAQKELTNYLTDNIRTVVKREVQSAKSRGKLFSRPRIYDDLLSSQPLCFNLFGELQQDLGLATAVFRSLTDGLVKEVRKIEFEYSPGRVNERYTNDNTAFDVYVEFRAGAAQQGFIGIEVKYHENMKDRPAEHRKAYDEIASSMGCFLPEHLTAVRLQPLQQIWRDHLLAGRLRQVGNFDYGRFEFVYPKGNTDCATAIQRYRECLLSGESLYDWTLEEIYATIRRETDAPWIAKVFDRYLDFDKVNSLAQRELAIA